jgi:DNA-binding NarL/FixJ family response regulator
MKLITILRIENNPFAPVIDDILSRTGQFSIFFLNAMTDYSQIYPDFIITDFDANEDVALFRIRRINKHFPQAKIIIITNTGFAKWAKPLMKAGVKGFLCPETNLQEMEECMLTAATGNNYFSPSIREAMLNTLIEKNNQHVRTIRLSVNEKKVASLLKKGETIDGIARLISMPVSEVNHIYTNIARKLKIQPSIPVSEYLNQRSISSDVI